MSNSNSKSIPNDAFFSDLFSKFNIAATYFSAEPYGSGHINDTYLVKTKPTLGQNHQNYQNHFDYIFQRINHKIFKNIPGLMDNIVRVTDHLRKKISLLPGHDANKETLTVILTKQGESFYIDSDGGHWRVYIFLADTHSYDQVKDPKVAYQGGIAFGRFQKLLADIDLTRPLYETIKDFHNIDARWVLFQTALKADVKNRATEVQKEIIYLEQYYPLMREILLAGQAGKIPLRVTHNDTKFNNVLLNSKDQAQCVIDLDTVMPGYVHYDFGDCLRTAANSAPEDEVDLSKVFFNLELFKGFTEGFLSEVGQTLSPVEIELLPLATVLLPYTIGLRFLTDYLNGDQYFKIHRPLHNLDRARCQFALAQSALSQLDHMKKFIQETL